MRKFLRYDEQQYLLYHVNALKRGRYPLTGWDGMSFMAPLGREVDELVEKEVLGKKVLLEERPGPWNLYGKNSRDVFSVDNKAIPPLRGLRRAKEVMISEDPLIRGLNASTR